MDNAEINNRTIFKRTIILLIVVCIISLSGFFTQSMVNKNEDRSIQEKVNKHSEQMAKDFKQEISRYETALTTLATFFNSTDFVTKEQFSSFVIGLNVKEGYPGIKGTAYILNVGPDDANTVNTESKANGVDLVTKVSDAKTHKAILYYVEPEDEQVPSGLDGYLIPGGKSGLDYSISQNRVGASTPLEYKIDGKSVVGFVMAYPTSKGEPIKLSASENNQNTGWVLSFVDTNKIFNLATSKDFSVVVTDHEYPNVKSEITTANPTKYVRNFSLNIGGRKVDFEVTPDKAFINSISDAAKASKYTFFLINAEIVIFLLALILWMHKSRRSKENTLGHQITHDVLTGLPNRLFLENWMSTKLASAPGKGKGLNSRDKIAVLFLDLDGFKAINDTLGHQAGDKFLIAVSKRLSNEIRGNDTLARLGGDEFIVVLDSVDQEIQAVRIAERLLEVVRFPVILDSGPVCVSASIGIAIATLDASTDVESIIRFADAAMYAAKQDRHNRIRVFDNKLKSIVDGRHEVESSIKGASIRGEIVDVLQPIVNVSTGLTSGYEALCRWNHPNFGILAPDQFLDAAKVTGEIIDIDAWMVNKAFSNAMEISQATNEPCRVWVNLSVRHLLQGDFYKHVLSALKNSPARADMIGVEIEESVFKVDSGLLYPFLNQLRELGIPIGLDDFGAEEASLQALKKYDYDVIKLGRNLINDFIEDPVTSIIPAVIQLAKTSNTKVVATGVETQEALQKIIDAGCDFVQGYVFSKPQPIENLVDLSPGFVWSMPLGVKKSELAQLSAGDSNLTDINKKKSS